MRRWRERTSHRNQQQERRGSNGTELCPFDNEFDAFLAGRYADWLSTANRAVPAWAWVNKVAHATIEELHAIATGPVPVGASGETVQWHLVSTLLAKEVLAAVAGDESRLAELQRETLVPAELQVARQWWAAIEPVDLGTVMVEAVHRAQLSSELNRKENGHEGQ